MAPCCCYSCSCSCSCSVVQLVSWLFLFLFLMADVGIVVDVCDDHGVSIDVFRCQCLSASVVRLGWLYSRSK